MTTVLLSSANNTLQWFQERAFCFGVFAHTLGSSLIISSAYQSKPTEHDSFISVGITKQKMKSESTPNCSSCQSSVFWTT